MDKFVPFAAVWYTWDDATGDKIEVPVDVVGEFHEPGDPVIAYDLVVTEDVGVYKARTRIGGIDSGSVGPR